MDYKLPPLNALRTFAAAARAGSFSRAGALLFVTQGAVSRQVKQLEQWLGQPLFYRTPQGIELTDGGRRLAEVIERSFGQISAGIDELRQATRRQTLAINVPPTFASRWLAPRLAGFRRLYPSIDLTINTVGARSCRDLRGFDCAIVFASQAWPDCEMQLLREERHILVASPTLWQGDLPPRLDEATLLHILDGEERIPVWEAWCRAHGIVHLDTAPGLSFSTLDQVIIAAEGGAGAAIVDEPMVQRELATQTLRRLNRLQTDGPHGYWFVPLATGQDKRAGVRLFHDWLLEQVAAMPCAPAPSVEPAEMEAEAEAEASPSVLGPAPAPVPDGTAHAVRPDASDVPGAA